MIRSFNPAVMAAPAVLAVLAGLLDTEGRNARASPQQIIEATGQDFGFEFDAWQKWYRKNT